MKLPDYFIADLPAEATLTPTMVREACQTLRRNRAQHLGARSTDQIISVVSSVARDWLQADYPFRKLALDLGPAATGFPRATLAQGLDAFLQELTAENLAALLHQELGQPQRLETFASNPGGIQSRRAMATGPTLLAHVTAGNIPSPALTSIVLGLLARSAQFVKCSRGSSLLPRLFAHSIYDVEPKIGACLEIAEWPGGSLELEEVLFREADCVTATGTDATLASVRNRLPVRTRFLGYGHRVSFGFMAREAMNERGAGRWIDCAAEDVVVWNQLGCLSPHVFYVESGGELSPERVAESLAGELKRREGVTPRGELSVEESAVIALKREFYQVRAGASDETRLWQSENSTAWTVVYEADARFQVSCLNRFIYVKPVADLAEALRNAEDVRGRVSTVGLAAASPQARELAMQLAHWGVARVCPLGSMQRPPLTWRHDGRPTLGDLITWTDWEQ